MMSCDVAFDQVFDSQRVFRCLLEAVAKPGKLSALPPFDSGTPTEGVARTLLDHEVYFCAVGGESGFEERLSLLTGSRIAPMTEAEFVFIYEPDRTASKLGRGELARPELGATAIYSVTKLEETEKLSESNSLTLGFSGPGVPGERPIEIVGLPASEIEAIIQSRADYPLGVDVYLVDEAGWVAGLPRSTRLEVKG